MVSQRQKITLNEYQSSTIKGSLQKHFFRNQSVRNGGGGDPSNPQRIVLVFWGKKCAAQKIDFPSENPQNFHHSNVHNYSTFFSGKVSLILHDLLKKEIIFGDLESGFNINFHSHCLPGAWTLLSDGFKRGH